MTRSLYARLDQRFGPTSDALSRREMLRAALAASAGAVLGGGLLSGCAAGGDRGGQADRWTGHRVIIVGGGFAGLACAHELATAGVDVVVLEARSHVGGRVMSFRDFVPGKVVEGGGELIGSNHPTWLAYARRFNLEFLDVTSQEDLRYPIVIDGVRLSDDEAERLYLEMTEGLATMNDDAAGVDAEEPWASVNARWLDHRTAAEWLAGVRTSEGCKRAIRAQLTADNGVTLEQQSYLANLAQVKGGGVDRFWTDSEVFRCAGGNQQLADRLAAYIGERRIRTRTRVQSVEVGRMGVRVRAAGGERFEGDEVVLALPPSVWRDLSISPALPRDLTPQMGRNVKHLSALSRRYWLDAGLGPESLTTGDVALTWEATDNQSGDPASDACALVAFSGGDKADNAAARHRESRGRFYTKELEALYPGYSAHLTGTRFMDWPRDRLCRGGYSFPAPGELTTIGPVLARPHAQRLHFAGEHCTPKFVGYMEGALASGVRVARRISTGIPRAARPGGAPLPARA